MWLVASITAFLDLVILVARFHELFGVDSGSPIRCTACRSRVRIPGEGEKDSGVNVKTIPG
jgi:hypothetical protein